MRSWFMPAAPLRRARMRRPMTRRSLLLLGLLLATSFAVGRTAAAGPEIELENADGVPAADWLAFNRVNNHASGEYGHDNVTFASATPARRRWPYRSSTSPGRGSSTRSLRCRRRSRRATCSPYRCAYAASNGDFHTGTLEVISDDADEARRVVQLAGFWQKQSENDQEPGLGQIARVFGYTTTFVAPGQRISRQGRVEAIGEEVLSPYWRRADQSKPVTVRQLAAFHGCCNASTQSAYLRWHVKGSDTRTTLYRHAAVDGQALLPRKGDPSTGVPYADNRPAVAQFTPTAAQEPFGFNVDGEWTDPAKNDQTKDRANGCPTTSQCGHHVRIWPVRDRSGALVPNTYLIAGDYNGINYDYNDNLHLLENVVPETPGPTPSPAQALYRLDTGGTRDYLDANGQWWRPDAGAFAPNTVPAEGIATGQLPTDIKLTRDDWLFSSYRGNRGSVPQEQREITYNLPVGGAGTYYVRLYFAERYWTAAGQRVQDVLAEGALLASDLDNVDIFVKAGGANRAYVTSGKYIRVNDGTLNLHLPCERRPARRQWDRGVLCCRVPRYYIDAYTVRHAGRDGDSCAKHDADCLGYADSHEPTAAPSATPTPSAGELTWTLDTTTMAIKRSEALGGALGGKLYVFSGYTYYSTGGTRGYTPTRRVDVFNPATATMDQAE